MKIFESFNDYIKNDEPIIKRKGKLLTYEIVDTLMSDNGIIMLDDNTIYSFFFDNRTVQESSTLNSLNSFYFDEDLLTIPPESALAISKGVRPLFDKIADVKYPNKNFEIYFNEAHDILKSNTSRNFRSSLEYTKDWYNENYNSLQGLKELSVYTHVPPKELGFIFDVKYIFILALISKKVINQKVKIKRY